MSDQQHDTILTDIHRMVSDLHEGWQYLRKHRNMLYGTPILEFDEVCSLLRQSERTVRRLRERGLLVGFTFGRRRLYSMQEVQAFIDRMKSGQLQEEYNRIMNDDHGDEKELCTDRSEQA